MRPQRLWHQSHLHGEVYAHRGGHGLARGTVPSSESMNSPPPKKVHPSPHHCTILSFARHAQVQPPKNEALNFVVRVAVATRWAKPSSGASFSCSARSSCKRSRILSAVTQQNEKAKWMKGKHSLAEPHQTRWYCRSLKQVIKYKVKDGGVQKLFQGVQFSFGALKGMSQGEGFLLPSIPVSTAGSTGPNVRKEDWG